MSDDFLEAVQEQLQVQIAYQANRSVNTVDLKSDEAFPGLPTSTAPKVISTWKPKTSQQTERFEIPAKMLARQQLGKQSSASQVCKEAMSKFKSTIEYSTTKSQSMTFLITGTTEAVKLSKKHLMNTLSVKVAESMMVPATCRAHIVGKQGATLKSIIQKTGTTIQVDKYEGDGSNDEDEIVITINGTMDAIQEAKGFIDAIVAERSSNYRKRVTIERCYHRFLLGEKRSLLEKEFDVKIHVPPVDSENQDNKLDEIVVVGDRSQVLKCDERLKQIYEELQVSTRTLSINVPKKQHRLIIGPKGSIMQEIFKKSGCVVEIPPSADPSDTVVIRGPENMLSVGLQLVLENANSIFIGKVDISTYYKGKNPADFAKFLALKEKSNISPIETKYGCTIFRIPNSSVFEFQSKSQLNFKNAKADFSKFVEEKAKNIHVYSVDIPTELHRFLLGKGGQNVQRLKAKAEMKGQLIDLLVPSASDESEQVLVAIQKQANQTMEEQTVDEIKVALLAETEAIANMVNEIVLIDPKFHGRLIGAGGSALKELLSQFDESVNIRFPSNNSEKFAPNEITIRGPKQEVPKVISKLKAIVKDLEKMEALIGHEDSLVVPSEYGKRLIGSGKDTAWIVKSIREKHQKGTFKLLPSEAALKDELVNNNGNLYLNFEVIEGSSGDSIIIKGPKSVVSAAKLLLKEKSTILQNSLDLTINLFDEVSAEAKARLAEISRDTKKVYIRQLIGKEGKGLKKILEDYDVSAHFAKENEDDTESDQLGVVQIHGNKDGVLAVRKVFVNFMNEKILNSFEIALTVPQEALSQIVGRGGSNMAKISHDHNVKIDFGVETDGAVECFLQGSQEGCESAKQIILDIVKNVADTIDLIVHVPLQFHRLIIGPSGNHIKEFIDRFGSEKVRATFPKGGLQSKDNFNAIVFTANESLHDEIKNAMDECISKFVNSPKFPGLVMPEESRHKVEVVVPKEDINFVCGKSFETLVDIMKKFGVSVWLTKPSGGQITIQICGTAALQKDVESAKSDIMSRTRHSKSIPLPNGILDILSNENTDSERLKSMIQRMLRKYQNPGLIISLVPSVVQGHKYGSVSVKGELKKVNDISKTLEGQLTLLNTYRFIEEIEFPTAYRGHIIGRKGQNINRIKKETDCLLDLEESTKPGSAMVVIRSKAMESLELARQKIQEIVDEQNELNKKEVKVEAPVIVETNVVRDVPGFVSRNKLPPSAHKISSVVSSVCSMSDLFNGFSPAPTSEWKSVPKKGKAEELNSSTSKTVVQPIQPPVGSTPKKEPKAKKAPEQIATISQPTIEEVKPLPRAPSPVEVLPVVDEWQTVNTGKKLLKKEEKQKKSLEGIPLSSTLQLLADVDNDTSSEASKKRKKKKKKAAEAV